MNLILQKNRLNASLHSIIKVIYIFAALAATLSSYFVLIFVFFFQAEDGIRDHCVTGVQTCALPISWWGRDVDWWARFAFLKGRNYTQHPLSRRLTPDLVGSCNGGEVAKDVSVEPTPVEIGRASCRERVESGGVAVAVKK